MNLGFLGKGNASLAEPLAEQIRAGAIGLKLHEDWGTTPAAIDNWPRREPRTWSAGRDPHRHAERVGLPSRPRSAFKGRTIHTFHTEGAGGGTRRTSSKSAASRTCCVLDQSDTPFHRDTIAEHLDMLMVCHHLDARSRRTSPSPNRASRKETSPPRILHDLGGLSMMSRTRRRWGGSAR